MLNNNKFYFRRFVIGGGISLLFHLIFFILVLTLTISKISNKKTDIELIVDVDEVNKDLSTSPLPIVDEVKKSQKKEKSVKTEVVIKKISTLHFKLHTEKPSPSIVNFDDSLKFVDKVKTSNSEQKDIKKFKKRIKKRGRTAGYEQAQTICSLIWNTTDDLDLILELPNNREIYSSRKKDEYYKANLDIDSNRYKDELSIDPIENIFWDEKMKKGKYKFYARLHNLRSDDLLPVQYMIKLRVGYDVFYFKGKLNKQDQEYLVIVIDVTQKGDVRLLKGDFFKKTSLNISKNEEKIPLNFE